LKPCSTGQCRREFQIIAFLVRKPTLLFPVVCLLELTTPKGDLRLPSPCDDRFAADLQFNARSMAAIVNGKAVGTRVDPSAHDGQARPFRFDTWIGQKAGRPRTRRGEKQLAQTGSRREPIGAVAGKQDGRVEWAARPVAISARRQQRTTIIACEENSLANERLVLRLGAGGPGSLRQRMPRSPTTRPAREEGRQLLEEPACDHPLALSRLAQASAQRDSCRAPKVAGWLKFRDDAAQN